MLARTQKPACVECGLAYGAPGFVFYHGEREQGPAYWSDRGLLCSPVCATGHARKRFAEGTMPKGAVECPVVWEVY
ncbi:MAG: hypothetical protein EON95_16770 [Caulobacteraceae bacterium]|nr:hypothetical protein [Caulobacter sp.]RYF90526.1 MAG: hypothetical protein EON95_16770 [Caulobacteraceae bacterium]